jgi:hypothetical protein
MPIYNFRVSGLDRSDETISLDLPHLNIAKCEAVRFTGEALCDEADAFWDRAEWCLTVTDETGLALFQLLLLGTEAPAVTPGARPRR